MRLEIKNMNKREYLIDTYPREEFMFAVGFDDAIIGVIGLEGEVPKIAYSYSKIIEILMKDMPHIEAVEYFNFKIADAFKGEKTPFFINDDLLN